MNLGQLAPGRYFISHSYRDAAEREQLVRALPSHVLPFIFPPITVGPDKFVSTPLMEAILACDGMISLAGGDSEESFWVTFEREFAKRNRVNTYTWNAADMTLDLDSSSVHSEVIALSDPGNWSQVDRVIDHLRTRSFDVVSVRKDSEHRWVPRQGTDLRLTPATRVSDPSFVIFVGGDTSRDFLNELGLLGRSGRLYPHRVSIAFLTTGHAFPKAGHAFPNFDDDELDAAFLGEFMLRWGAIVDDLESHIVYLRDGVGGPVLATRIDDLMVRVSWNMYRARGPVR